MTIGDKLKSIGKKVGNKFKSYGQLGKIALYSLPLVASGVADAGALAVQIGIGNQSDKGGIEEVVSADGLYLPANNVWVLGSGTIEHSEATDSTDVYGTLGVYGCLKSADGDQNILLGMRTREFPDDYERDPSVEADVSTLFMINNGIAVELGVHSPIGELGHIWGIDGGVTAQLPGRNYLRFEGEYEHLGDEERDTGGISMSIGRYFFDNFGVAYKFEDRTGDVRHFLELEWYGSWDD